LTDWGSYRIALLVVDFIFIIAISETAGYFINKARRKPERRISLLFGVTFLVMSLAMLFSWLKDYYFSEEISQLWLSKLYSITVSVSIAIFCYSIENEYKLQLKTKRLVTILSFTCAILVIIFPSDPTQGVLNLIYETAFILAELLFLVPIFFIIILGKNNTGPVKTRILIAGVGYVIVMLGVGVTHRRTFVLLEPILPIEEIAFILFIFKIIICIGLLLIFIGFRSEVYLETVWQDKLLEQYTIHKESRQCIYSKRFGVDFHNEHGSSPQNPISLENINQESQPTKKTSEFFEFGIKIDSTNSATPEELRVRYEIENSSLFSSGVIGILETIKDVSNNEKKPVKPGYKKTVKKKIVVIDKGHLKFLIMESHSIVNVFIVKSDISILRFFLRRFTEEVENYFGVLLSTKSLQALEKTNIQSSMEYIAQKVFNQYRSKGSRRFNK
jgi:hypothetical protein